MSTTSEKIIQPVASTSQKANEDSIHKLVSDKAKKREAELNELLQKMLSITKGKPIIIDNSRR